MRGVLLSSAVLSAIPIILAPQTARDTAAPPTLVPGAIVERRLARGDEDRFEISIAAGDVTTVVVEQRGLDVRVLVRDSADAIVDEAEDAQGPNGQERIEVASRAPVTATLSIAAAPGAAPAGDYRVWIEQPRTASAADLRMQDARTLRARARPLEHSGHYVDARALLEQALAIGEAERGPEDPEVAFLLYDLAGNALERQDNVRSRTLFERATAIFDSTWGPESPYSAMARSRLALLDERAGQRQKAEAGIRAVLPPLENALGADHPWYLLSLVTLANLRNLAGDAQQAEAINRRGIAALERTGQTDTMLEATFINNLADILRTRGDAAAAESMFARSLAIGESIVGGDSLFVATALQNLGIMARQRKDYPSALASYRRSIAIRERLLGPEHPIVAGVLINLANVYRAMGDHQKALETHFRALHMWESNVGPYGRETLITVGNIARTYAGMGDIDNALAFQRRTDAILETELQLYLATGSERMKLAFVRTEADRTDRTISLHLRQAPENADAAALAALVLLQRKGRVQDAMTDLFASVRQRVTNESDRAVLDQLKDTTAQLARVALGVGSPRDGQMSLPDLESRKEQLEATLSDRSAAFRAAIQPVTLEHVQETIPGDAALVEYAVFRPFDPEAERNEDAYGPPHYAAYVIATHGAPTGVDLGAVEDIDPLVVRMRDGVRDPSIADVKARARAVDERVIQPIRRLLTGATRLLISPDGGLNLVPFEALLDEHGRYLIERYSTTYLTSGRDLLRLDTPRATPSKPLIVADPLFGEPVAASTLRAMRNDARETRRSVTVGADVSSLYFAPLSGSAMEGRAIKSLFPDATLLTGRRASKAALEGAAAPSILHIASHGFFLDDGAAGPPALAQNPLLRSGLALAGANLPGAAQGDGILTALEAAGLDLWGTHLVTLSACDTGVGEVHNGEGVYGLRRAFMLAGAETLVMSLWPVTDSLARDTMVAYYARLRTGTGRGDALRQAKLSILKRPAQRHPYYWAGFIQSGDWTRLRAH